jgi:hypothetical protein
MRIGFYTMIGDVTNFWKTIKAWKKEVNTQTLQKMLQISSSIMMTTIVATMTRTRMRRGHSQSLILKTLRMESKNKINLDL